MRRAPHVALVALAALASCRRGPVVEVDAAPAELAPKDTSPPKAPPPLRAPKPPVPPLPDLPPLAAQAAISMLPADVRLDGFGACKGVWNGSFVAPRSCAMKASLFSSQVDGARPLVPSSLLDSDLTQLPPVIDHRADGTEGPVRSQGAVPACTAFAEAAAIDHAIGRWLGKPSRVSVMQIWSRYHTATEAKALAANLGQPLGSEDDWPFAVNEANGWLACDDVDAAMKKKYGCGLPVAAAHGAKAASNTVARFTRVRVLDPTNISTMRVTLAEGQDIVVAMRIPESFVPKGKAGARYVPHWPSVDGDTGHAMTIAGYAALSQGTYFLLHNSWGPTWGDAGYAWVHEQTVAKWTREAVVIDAEPAVRDAQARPVRARGQTACAAGLVQDSIKGTCAAPCPDQSPRHNGVCPAAKDACPPSYVNLTGTCVLAAPKTSGRDPRTGISWTCGFGGCAYVLPRAEDPGCTGGTCQVSCPAPDYRVARDGQSIVCVE